jgi:hypothetical protein
MLFSHRSPLASPPDEEADLARLEDALRQVLIVPPALWAPEMRTEFNELAVATARMLLELYDLGRLRFVRGADGTIEAVLLDRRLH